MRYLPVVAIAIALAALGVALSQPGPTEPLTAEELGSLTGTEWYSVLILDKRSGYACMQTELVDTPDGPRLQVTEDVKILISLANQELEASKSQVTMYDDLLRQVSIEMVKDELGRVQRITTELNDQGITIRKSFPDNGMAEEVRTLQVADDFASDMMVAWQLAQGTLAVGDSLSFETYDPEVDALDRHDVLVDRRETMDDGTEATVLRMTSQKLGLEAFSWLDGEGRLLRQEIPGLMSLTLLRVPEEEALAELAPFEVTSEIDVEGRLPSARGLQSLTLRVARRAGAAAELIPETRRQQIVVEGDDALVTVEPESPPLTVATLPITDEALADCLVPTTHAQSDDPDIVAKAREIVGDETDAWTAAQAIVSWVYRNMRKISSQPKPISAVECLDEMAGYCTEHAVLTAALGRAVGLPTRMCTGLAWVGGGFGYHAWTEIYVGRWVEMDPAWGQMTVDAGHIQLHSSSLDEVSYARASLATGRTLGAIEIELVSYRDQAGQEVTLTED